MKIQSLSCFLNKTDRRNNINKSECPLGNDLTEFKLQNYPYDTFAFSGKLKIIIPEGMPKSLEEHIRNELKSKDGMDKIHAALQLGKLGIKENARLLKPLFKDRSYFIKLYALEAFEKLGNPNNAHWLELPAKDKSPDIRAKAAIVLRTIGNRKQADIALRLMNDKNLSVKAEGIRTLGKIGGLEYAENLIPVQIDNKGILTEAYADALGYIRGNKYVSELEKLLSSPHKRVRQAAANSIAKTANIKRLRTYLPKLIDGTTQEKVLYLFILGESKHPEFLEIIGKVLKTDSNEYVKDAARTAIIRIAQAN